MKSQVFAGVFSVAFILFTRSWWLTRHYLEMTALGENIWLFSFFFFKLVGTKTSTKIGIKYHKASINVP